MKKSISKFQEKAISKKNQKALKGGQTPHWDLYLETLELMEASGMEFDAAMELVVMAELYAVTPDGSWW